jgi:hypothetical protein
MSEIQNPERVETKEERKARKAAKKQVSDRYRPFLREGFIVYICDCVTRQKLRKLVLPDL